jgi:hypothetical protein
MLLGRGEAPSLSAGGTPDCCRNHQNRTIRFAKPNNLVFPVSNRSFPLLSDSYRNTFCNSNGESTTSSTSSMKHGNPCGNTFWQLYWGIEYFKNVKHEGWKLWQQRIWLQQEQHPQAYLWHLTEEGRKAFEAYLADLQKLFLSRCEVTWQETILRDTTPIVFNTSKVIPEVWPDPSPSLNDFQSMINFALERLAKSTDELLHRLIEERDRKNTYAIRFIQTNPHTSGASMVALPCQTPLPSRWTTFIAELLLRVRLLLLGCSSKLRPTCLGKGIHTPRLVFLCQTFPRPRTPRGAMTQHMHMLVAATKLPIPP